MRTTFCQTCGAPLDSPNAKFCARCGEPVYTARSCPHCGAELVAGAQFCSACGERVASGEDISRDQKATVVEAAPAARERETRYVERVARAVENGDEIPDIPETRDENGYDVVRADDYFAHERAVRNRNKQQDSNGQQRRNARDDMFEEDFGGDNAPRNAQADDDPEATARERLVARRKAEFEERQRIREQDDDDGVARYDREVDLPSDADRDVGTPMSFLADRARNRNDQERMSERSYDNYGDRPDRGNADERGSRRGNRQQQALSTTRGGKIAKKGSSEITAEQRRFQNRANRDGYYDDRRVDDYDENTEEEKGVNMFTLVIGMVAIAAFGIFMVFAQRLIS